MAKVREMQGVPAHLEYLKRTDNHRRHPAHCIFHEDKGRNRICTNPHCGKYMQACNSAKNCDYYEEEEKCGD